jgi:hypothetical protein
MADRAKCKEVHKEAAGKLTAIAKEEALARELAASCAHLERALANGQDKVFQLQKTTEQKRARATQALDETERKRRELALAIQQDESQLSANKGMISRKQQQSKDLAAAHDREVAELQQRYHLAAHLALTSCPCSMLAVLSPIIPQVRGLRDAAGHVPHHHGTRTGLLNREVGDCIGLRELHRMRKGLLQHTSC